MKRRLLLLNVALVAAIGFTGWQLRQAWLGAGTREQTMFKHSIPPQPAPPVASRKPVSPVSASTYAEIAQKMLFSKDRNPTVVVEVQPPPPKPMPPLPVLHGVMYLGESPTVLLSDKNKAEHTGVHPGETFGEFKLVEVTDDEISFEWDGQVINKKVDEMMEKDAPPAPATNARTGNAPSGPVRTAQAPTAPTVTKIDTPRGAPAPGANAGAGLRACQPGDSSPPGTIADGMRKVVTYSPFGETCRWEPLK